MTGLIVLALTLSVYLSWHYLVGGSVIGCAGGSSCDQVLSSRWSAIGGILPVSGLAAGAYLAMLAASLFIGPATAPPVRRLAWGALLVLVGSAAGSAVWFIILQKWAIGAFCPYCMTAHITGLVLAALVIWRAPRELQTANCGSRIEGHWVPNPQSATCNPQVDSRLAPYVIGLVLAGVLAACQVVITPPSVYRGGASQDSNLPAFDPHAVPLVGAPDALYVVTLLFDYKCPHCQEMHFMLDEVVRRYGGKLAFTLCPAPLNTRCNPYIPRDVEAYKDSCELARVGLAVWLASREAFPAFELWMFSLESGDRWQPRSLDAARAKAVELVGQAKFDTAGADPWIDRYLQTSVRIYGATVAQSGNNAVPKLVFGPRWVIPEPVDGDDLIRILQDSLAVPKP
jgi:uncharacterized membrane protein/protein-disulfide isomerase